MDIKELEKLRQKTIEGVVPAILEDEGDAQSSFELILRLIQTGSVEDTKIYNKAYELANKIEDKTAKSDAMFRLLEEIDITLDQLEGADMTAPEEDDEVEDESDEEPTEE